MRKVYMELKMRVIVRADEDADLDDVLAEISVKSDVPNADIEVLNVESKIVDGK